MQSLAESTPTLFKSIYTPVQPNLGGRKQRGRPPSSETKHGPRSHKKSIQNLAENFEIMDEGGKGWSINQRSQVHVQSG